MRRRGRAQNIVEAVPPRKSAHQVERQMPTRRFARRVAPRSKLNAAEVRSPLRTLPNNTFEQGRHWLPAFEQLLIPIDPLWLGHVIHVNEWISLASMNCS